MDRLTWVSAEASLETDVGQDAGKREIKRLSIERQRREGSGEVEQRERTACWKVVLIERWNGSVVWENLRVRAVREEREGREESESEREESSVDSCPTVVLRALV